MQKGAFVVAVLMLTVSGCLGAEIQGGSGNQKDTDERKASVSFSEEKPDLRSPVHIAIQVESVGSYDFIWVEADGVEGGYRLNRSSSRPSLYISDDGLITTAFGVCYMESLTAQCGTYTGDPTNFYPSVDVYGVEDGEKTLIDQYSLAPSPERVSYTLDEGSQMLTLDVTRLRGATQSGVRGV